VDIIDKMRTNIGEAEYYSKMFLLKEKSMVQELIVVHI
jgi:hypothetical protein